MSKSFGPTPVLCDIDLVLGRGEIHGLVGMNGSGKSTLIKVVSGYHRADSGAIRIAGNPVTASTSAAERRRMGLRLMHQDIGLADNLTVAENLFVGRFPTRFAGRLDRRAMRTRATDLLARFGIDGVDPAEPLSGLGPAERALLGIARAFDDGDGVAPALVVLDEPTAALTAKDVDRLFSAIRIGVAGGASVLFVTHEIKEILEITDRVTALRDGRVVGQAETSRQSASDLIRMIVGRDVVRSEVKRTKPVGSAQLVVRDLTSRTIRGLSLAVHSGEVVGLTGLVGAGHEDVPYLLIGAQRVEQGTVTTETGSSSRPDPVWAARAGISLLPADRSRDSAIPSASVRENATMGNLRLLRRWKGLDLAAEAATSRGILEQFAVKSPGDRARLRDLSGGNQQKVLLGRAATSGRQLILLHSPTQGVDVEARQGILRAVRTLAEQGVAVLYVSNDYAELGQVCDRVLVMRRGRLVEEFHSPAATHDAVLVAAATA